MFFCFSGDQPLLPSWKDTGKDAAEWESRKSRIRKHKYRRLSTLSTTDRLAFSKHALSPRLSSIPSLPFLSRVLPYSSHSPDESGIRLLRVCVVWTGMQLFPPPADVPMPGTGCVCGRHQVCWGHTRFQSADGQEPPIVKCKKISTANRKDRKMLFQVCCHFCHFRDLLNLMIEIRLGWIWKVTADEIKNKTEQRRTYQDLTRKLKCRMNG